MWYLIGVWSTIHNNYNILDKDENKDILERVLKVANKASASYDDASAYYVCFNIVDEDYIKNNPLSEWSKDYTK